MRKFAGLIILLLFPFFCFAQEEKDVIPLKEQIRVLEKFILPPAGAMRQSIEKIYGKSDIDQDDYGVYRLCDGSYQLDVRYKNNKAVESGILFSARPKSNLSQEESIVQEENYIKLLIKIQTDYWEKLEEASWNMVKVK